MVGALMVLAALGYALKAYREAVYYEGGLKDTVRQFAPMGPGHQRVAAMGYRLGI